MRAKWVDWAISGGGLLVFALLAWLIHTPDSALAQFDARIAEAAKENAEQHVRLLQFARSATDAGDTLTISVLAIVVSLLFLRRYPRLAVIWLLAALLAGTVIQHSKEWFDRPRPGEALRDEAVQERNPSFPSGHAMGSMVGYCGLAYVGFLVLRWRWAKVTLAAACALMILLIGWTRIFLRAHWCSDVLGGWALGICWLSLCSAIVHFAWGAVDSKRVRA
jgi:undecaprenyl-diphosphatase